VADPAGGGSDVEEQEARMSIAADGRASATRIRVFVFIALAFLRTSTGGRGGNRD
jgi:hypothetical protein